MENSHQHWRALNLNVPVSGTSDPWIAGRRYSEISADVAEVLGGRGGLKAQILGDTVGSDGQPESISLHFWYDDLPIAIEAFAHSSERLGLPDRTRLTHVERFPDCSFKHHVMIHWIDGRLDSYSKELTDEVLLDPNSG